MLGERKAEQFEFFAGSLRDLIPDEHVLARVDRVLDLTWLREEVAALYCPNQGRPGVEPEVAVRLMLVSLLLGLVHDRRLMREAAVNVAIRWFVGVGLTGHLPDHSSMTRIRQRWGETRFRRIFQRSVAACVGAGSAKGEVVDIDASLNDDLALLRARRRRLRWSERDVELYRRHRWRAEGAHGEAKSWHDLARAVRRGLGNMRIQAYLTAAAINLKRLEAAFAAPFCIVLAGIIALLATTDEFAGYRARLAYGRTGLFNRPRVHFMRSALAHVAEGQHTMVAAAIRQAFLEDDHAAAIRTWRTVADQERLLAQTERVGFERIGAGELGAVGIVSLGMRSSTVPARVSQSRSR